MSYLMLNEKSKTNMKSHATYLAIVVRLPFAFIPFILTILKEPGTGE